MRDATDYLYVLSDIELLEWWGLARTYPTTNPKQRRRLDGLIAGEFSAEKLPEAARVPRLMRPADLMPWGEPLPPHAKPNRQGKRVPRPVESDQGEWWPDTRAAGNELGVGLNTIRDGCRGRYRVRGRTLAYSKHKTRPVRVAAA